VGVRTSKIGNKSLVMEQALIHAETGEVLSSGTVITVAYDYGKRETMPVPETWRGTINQFEGLG
jgi:acyl-CoA thioester hydrolase